MIHLVTYIILAIIAVHAFNAVFGTVYLCYTWRRSYVRRREVLRRQLTLHKLRTLVNKCLVEYAPNNQ